MSDLDLVALGALAERAARAGGEIVRAEFGTPRQETSKGPGDWVSEVDLRSEEIIRTVLAESGLPVHGEEAGGERADIGWFVDPLDGTTNFLRGIHAVGVSVGLIAHGKPVAGAVFAPLLDEMFTATAGGGAYRDGARLHVSSRPEHEAIVATGFPFRRKDRMPEYDRVLQAVFTHLEDIRRIGAASLDLAWTAAGVLDGYFELFLGPWDVAAGALLVREAGGVITDWEGDANAWLTSGCIVAGSSVTHAALLDCAKLRTT